jgi:DNA polymerase-3 subunit epsilon
MSGTKASVIERVARLMRDGCVIIDLETTGFVEPSVAIVEVAVIDQRGDVLLNTLVKPDKRIPSGASAVHGIFDHDVADAQPFDTLYPQLAEIMGGRCVVSYNYTFEKGILEAVCKRYRQPMFEVTWTCAMRDYATYKRLSQSRKLTQACLTEGIMIKDAHRALGDCLMTLALMRKMAGESY